MSFDSLINGTDSVAVEKAAASQTVVTLHRVAADCYSACGKHALSASAIARSVGASADRTQQCSVHAWDPNAFFVSPIQPNQNLIREIRVICGAFQAFRVTAREISRSTSVNGQKSLLTHEKSKKPKTKKNQINQRNKKMKQIAVVVLPDSDHFAGLEPGQTSVTITDRPNPFRGRGLYRNRCRQPQNRSGYFHFREFETFHQGGTYTGYGSHQVAIPVRDRIPCLAARARPSELLGQSCGLSLYPGRRF